MDWDGERVTFSNQGLGVTGARGNGDAVGDDGVSGGFGDGALPTRAEAQRQLREFIRNFRRGAVYPCREQLLQRWRKREPWLTVSLGDVQQYDSALFALLQTRPVEMLPLFEAAAKDALERLVASEGLGADPAAPDGLGADEDGEDGGGGGGAAGVGDIHVVLSSDQRAQPIRSITADHVNSLVKVPGIVVSATRVRAKAVAVVARCSKCGACKTLQCAGPFGSVVLPQVTRRRGGFDSA